MCSLLSGLANQLQKICLFGTLAATIGCNLLWNILECKSYMSWWSNNSSREGFLILPHPLTNLEKEKYYQGKSEFNGVHSRNKLSKIKDGEYVTNLDEYKSIGTPRLDSHVNDDNAASFNRFGVECIPK